MDDPYERIRLLKEEKRRLLDENDRLKRENERLKVDLRDERDLSNMRFSRANTLSTKVDRIKGILNGG